MEIVRGLYLWTCYIIGVPLLLMFFIPAVLITSIISKIQCGEFGLKDFIGAVLYGIREGHKINMIFVKYGRQGYKSEVGL